MQSGLGKTKQWLAEYISDKDKIKDSKVENEHINTNGTSETSSSSGNNIPRLAPETVVTKDDIGAYGSKNKTQNVLRYTLEELRDLRNPPRVLKFAPKNYSDPLDSVHTDNDHGPRVWSNGRLVGSGGEDGSKSRGEGGKGDRRGDRGDNEKGGRKYKDGDNQYVKEKGGIRP